MLRADKIYKALNGIFCAYKPRGQNPAEFQEMMLKNIFKRINSPDISRPLKKRIQYHEENFGTNKPLATLVPDLSDHVLVTGLRYLKSDFVMESADELVDTMSGLCVYGINDCPELFTFKHARQIRVYHVHGLFGKATDDFTDTGLIREKSTYRHINKFKLERLLAKVQAGHQKYMYHVAGVDMASQEAYDLATSGLLRAKVGASSNHVIYGIKLLDFQLPEFVLEIHCVNETAETLGRLIHHIGLELRSNACVQRCRRIRWGHFTLEHAMANADECGLDVILNNLVTCRELLQANTVATDATLQERDPVPVMLQGAQWKNFTLDSTLLGRENAHHHLESGGKVVAEHTNGVDSKHCSRVIFQAKNQRLMNYDSTLPQQEQGTRKEQLHSNIVTSQNQSQQTDSCKSVRPDTECEAVATHKPLEM